MKNRCEKTGIRRKKSLERKQKKLVVNGMMRYLPPRGRKPVWEVDAILRLIQLKGYEDKAQGSSVGVVFFWGRD